MVLEDIAKQLEGRYFIFRFSCDWAEGDAYAVNLVRDGKMIGAYNPLQYNEFALVQESDQEVFKTMEEIRLKEIYTIERRPLFPQTFLGHVLHYMTSLNPDAKHGEDTFYHYEGLVSPFYSFSAHKRTLAEHGVELKVLDDSTVLQCLREVSTDAPPPSQMVFEKFLQHRN